MIAEEWNTSIVFSLTLFMFLRTVFKII
jgi:hypothetical protein